MHVRVPFPVWAMNPREARDTPLSNTSDSPADDLLDVIDE
jgi:hypothetical protein